jgi:hypothetical protein
MALNDGEGVPVASGVWLYDGAVEKDVRVLARGYDDAWLAFYADGHGAGSGEPPPLNLEGVLYFVDWPGSPAFESLAEARAWADRQPWGPVRWRW